MPIRSLPPPKIVIRSGSQRERVVELPVADLGQPQTPDGEVGVLQRLVLGVGDQLGQPIGPAAVAALAVRVDQTLRCWSRRWRRSGGRWAPSDCRSAQVDDPRAPGTTRLRRRHRADGSTYDRGQRNEEVAVAERPSRPSRFELVDGPPRPAPDASAGPSRPRRRQNPTAMILLFSGVVLVVASALVLPHRSEDAGADLPSPSLVTNDTTPATSCDLGTEGCRVLVAARWRDRTAQVLREHLDPEDVYFTGYSYSANTRYTTGPRLNALGLEIYRLVGGGTEVFVQVARSDADALRCGTVTHHRCVRQRLADGQEFWMTTTDGMQDGIEIQHSPEGSYVVTLAARNVRGGSAPEVTYSDLIAVAQDPRLRPPPE